MRDKFVANDFEIDLSRLRTNFTEENPRFKDSVWTKYTLPVDIYYDRDFRSSIGQYSSITNENLPKIHSGKHVFMGKVRDGELEFSEFRNKKCTIQINSGFEELPNFDTKLSDLPFETVEVEDIYDHANEIVAKKYPETNYNFPKLYTDAFDLDSEGYKYFDSFLNNRVLPSGGSTKVFPRNEIQENTSGWDCINRNIIVPLPYLLYVLKVGFEDAGFTLQGDILEDEYLKQRLIYGNSEYYTTENQEYQKTYVYENEYFDNEVVSGSVFGRWRKEFKISAPGKYRIIGSCYTNHDGNSSLTISRDGEEIFIFGSGTSNTQITFDQVVEIGISDAENSVTISLEFYGRVWSNQTNSEDVNIGIAEIKINPMRQNTAAGDPIPFVFNFNRVDISRAVPDWTFGDLVTCLKNWRNYDLTFDGSFAIMNRIVVNKNAVPEDFTSWEIQDPVRSRNDKSSFYLQFPDVDGVSLDDIYYTESGYSLNPASVPSEATTIDINGFCLPLTTFRATTTAQVFDESALMLVYYDGLNENGDNHAKNPNGLHGTYLAEDNKDWYMNRLTNFTFKWTFIINKNKMRRYNIRSEIYAYHKKHWIKSWVVNSISDFHYSVEIETETF